MTFATRRPSLVLIALAGIVLAGAGVVAGVRFADARAAHEARPVVVLSRDGSISLPYVVVKASDARGCPPYSFSSPAMGESAGDRKHVVLLGGTRLTAVTIICMGRSSELGNAEKVISLKTPGKDGLTMIGHPVTVRSAFGEATRIDMQFLGPDRLLTEWWVDHGEWLYVVGYLRATDDDRTSTVEAMLASWTWY